MNKLILTGLLAAGAMTHIQGAQFAGQENQQQDPKDKSRRPNILFILSDDHTSQAWGIYGGVLADYAYNSNIRRLANEGVVLDNCFCTNSISAPSRASILTGLYSHRNGLYTLADSLDTSIPTLATVLQANGYNTGLVGKWHIKIANRKGFRLLIPFSTTRENTATLLSSKAATHGRATVRSASACPVSPPTSSQKKRSTGSSSRTATSLS